MTATIGSKTGSAVSVPDDSGIRCTCNNFKITLRPQDKIGDAEPLLATHLKYCPQAKPNWLAAIAEGISSGPVAFVVLVLVLGWNIHEHGWPWLGR